MTKRTALWLAPALLYGLFIAWYTDFGGPLREEEIAVFLERLEGREGIRPEGLRQIEKFMREDTGRQFLMVNIIDLADDPPDVAGAAAGEDAQALMGRYMAYMFPQLLRRACHPTVVGYAINHAMDVVGIDNARVWDQGALMRYRSRRSMMEIVADADQGDAHRFKVASLEKTIAFPIEPVFHLSDLRLLLGLFLLAVTALADSLLLRGARGNAT